MSSKLLRVTVVNNRNMHKICMAEFLFRGLCSCSVFFLPDCRCAGFPQVNIDFMTNFIVLLCYCDCKTSTQRELKISTFKVKKNFKLKSFSDKKSHTPTPKYTPATSILFAHEHSLFHVFMLFAQLLLRRFYFS